MKKIKKNLIRVSFIAMGLALATYMMPATSLADETDVTFAGKYNDAEGNSVNANDPLVATTYGYMASNGDPVTDVPYNTDPTATDFTYTDGNGNSATLPPEGSLPTYADYPGDTHADGNDAAGTIRKDTAPKFQAGVEMNRGDYQYKNGKGNMVDLGTGPQDMVETRTLSSYANSAVVTTTNGVSDVTVNGKMYSFTLTSTHNKFTLTATGDGVVDEDGVETPASSLTGDVAAMYALVKPAYDADIDAIEANETNTGNWWTAEGDNFATASSTYNDDVDAINTLNGYYATIATAEDLRNEALANQHDAQDVYNENAGLQAAAQSVYNAPILATINDGAEDAITHELSDGGHISGAISDAVADETTRATTAEGDLRDDLTAEAESRDMRDMQLAQRLDDERDRAEGAEGDLHYTSTHYVTSGDNLTNAVSSLDAGLDSEVNRAKAAEGDLQYASTHYVTSGDNLTVAVTKLDANLADEAEARATADDTLTLNLNNEITRAEGAEAALGLGLGNEVSRATAAEAALNRKFDKKFEGLNKDLSAGVANAVALSSVEVTNVKKGEVSVGGGYGYYNDQSAVALGAAMGLTDNWSVNAAAGLARSDAAFRVGTNYKFKLF